MSYIKNKFSFFFILSLLSNCQLPPASYVLNTPLGFTCSTNYDPTLGIGAENAAKWQDSCPSSPSTWIRFSVYVNQRTVDGFVFYKSDASTTYETFQELVSAHIVNDTIIPNTTNIINFIANDLCESKDPGGVDRKQDFPSIYLNYPTKFTPPPPPGVTYNILGLDAILNRQASVIIPPLTCLGTGAFIVTMVDYTNKAESRASNIMTLS